MTREQWLETISKEELAFRMYGKDYFNRACWECVFYVKDKYGHYKCTAEDVMSNDCEKQFDEWLQEEME